MPASPLTPVFLLTGFLGSGKTTLLNRLLADPAWANTAVMLNEMGAIPLDQLLGRASSDRMSVLSNGCLCCSVAGDMVKVLRELYFERANGTIPPFMRVVIETTGLADPAPILHTLVDLPLAAARYAFAGILVTVDAKHGMGTLDRHREAIKQVAVADRLILTKRDLTDAGSAAALQARLSSINPSATQLDADAPAAQFLDTSLTEAGATRWLAFDRVAAAHRAAPTLFGDGATHDPRVRNFALIANGPLQRQAFEDALSILAEIAGERLLRLKGLVAFDDEPAPHAVHAVQHSVYPFARLQVWPDENRRNRMVVIVRDLDENSVLKLLGPGWLNA
ncbi:MAG: GTP-binding protein [Betaproteobacteria bacterium]|nr:GTP-binding protein [Betaproteobacteria bacterium]